MSAFDELLESAAAWASEFAASEVPSSPAKQLAIVACMDSRLAIRQILGLQIGDAHLITNAGGVVTDDTIRSLAISQLRLGTRSIVLIGHTGCGMMTITDEQFSRQLEEQTGARPEWSAQAFTDLDESLRASMARLRASPFVPHTDDVRAFVYDVQTGALREVE